MNENLLTFIVVVVVLLFTTVVFMLSRYRRCPSDKVMVIYGKLGKNSDGTQRSARCIHGGAAFVVPVFQAYQYLDLTPISISVDLKNALSKQNIRIDVPSRFTVGISTEVGIMQNAAERLLGLRHNEIQSLAEDIIFGQLRLIIATMDIEEINTDRDKFLDAVSSNVETELKKIGLRLINVNVTDITDESGYIMALGKEASAKAINDAKISVAEADRVGAIGSAAAERDMRINVSKSNSEAIKGENEAKVQVAESNATLREREAEAQKRATAAENIQAAKAMEESYEAQKADTEKDAAEMARQAYVAKMLGQKNLSQQLAASGYSGGLTESAMLENETNYQNNLNEIERQRQRTLAELQRAIENAKLTGDMEAAELLAEYMAQVQSAYSDYYLQGLSAQQAMAAAQAAAAQTQTIVTGSGTGGAYTGNGGVSENTVKLLQQQINSTLPAGQQIAVDGKWGPATTEAAGGMSASQYLDAYENYMNRYAFKSPR